MSRHISLFLAYSGETTPPKYYESAIRYIYVSSKADKWPA